MTAIDFSTDAMYPEPPDEPTTQVAVAERRPRRTVERSTSASLLSIQADEYHSDPCSKPSLSASVAATLISESPYRAWLRHPKLGSVKRPTTNDMDRGTIIHALVLGTEPNVGIVRADNYKKKRDQLDRDSIRKAGLTPVLEREWESYQNDAASVRGTLADRGFNLDGLSEHAVIWQEQTAHGPIVCRGMLDHVWLDQGVILDLKTCNSCHPRAIQSHIWQYGYDIQSAAYRSALVKLRPQLEGQEMYRWAFIELMDDNPPEIVIAGPTPELAAVGRLRWKRACETWASCLDSGEWPAYSSGEIFIDPPKWAFTEEASL